ncbi:DNA cytosine methyltransferase [Caulobacter sp. CCNWLY153]|uniref:DNA cytosine methyltransferase n=1 Tax=unclassified Caulobacter TaxID=2648921 RepID=UPI002FEEB2C0
MAQIVERRRVKHFHLACGSGSGAAGFNDGQARVGKLEAQMVCLGGIDVDPAAIADFEYLTGAKGTVRDLFSRDQYIRFWDREPPEGWTEALPVDLRIAAGNERPNIIFISAPCKGFSGLLPEQASKSVKYQALNELTLRCLFLALEAWADDPPEFFVFENVPRIATRGRSLLDEINKMLRAYGYAVAETTHDCGVLGNLAQSRKRFLLVARHIAKVPPFLYEPPQQPLRGVGEILDLMPLPGDERAGPMHRMPALQWQTWVRLAFVEAGSDWRSLNKLEVEGGKLRDYGIVPDLGGGLAVQDPRPTGADWNGDVLGVRSWNTTTGTVAGRSSPTNGAFSVADPRVDGHDKSVQLGIRHWDQPSAVIKGDVSVGTGPYAVPDPRIGENGPRFNNVFRIVAWDQAAQAVTAGGGNSAAMVADPRHPSKAGYEHTKYQVTDYADATRTVISASTTGDGAFAVADPRREHWGNGQSGVCSWDQHAPTVTSQRAPGQGTFSVADPRPTHGPAAHTNKHAVIAYDGASKAVTGSDRVGSGALSVADPRPVGLNGREIARPDHYGVQTWEGTSGAVIGNGHPWDNGRWSVADPRPDCLQGRDRDTHANQGHYGVVPWAEASKAVPGAAKNNNGSWSVADPRKVEPTPLFALPDAKDRLVCVIRALDGTWHRPFTTLELAGLQSFFNPEVAFAWLRDPSAPLPDKATMRRLGMLLDGKSDSAWRERIGNAVPRASAKAIGSVFAQTLLLAWSGESFMLSAAPIWVQPLAIALAVQTENQPHE